MYLTFAEFQTLCPDSSITEQQYNALENRAESDIDTLTFNRITAIGFNNLTAFQQDKVRLALSQQTAFVFENAELLDSPLSSYSISGVSMSFDSSKVIITAVSLQHGRFITRYCRQGFATGGYNEISETCTRKGLYNALYCVSYRRT